MTSSVLRVALVSAALLAGCSGIESKKLDYKSDAKQVRPLEIPPDLASPNTSDRYTVPEGGNTASSQTSGQPQPANAQLLPASGKAYMERGGSQRWLVVQATGDKVWPVLKEFWQEQGFIVVTENGELGIMETDWAENRAKIPQGLVRNLIGKVLDQAYSTPERDKFRTRIERGQKTGTTEVYVSHRGMYEVYVNDANLRQTGRTVWQPRASDPELEAEMLNRLKLKFTGDQTTQTTTAKTGSTPVVPTEPRAVVGKSDKGAPVLKLKDDFDRAWRRVGLSLDRLGFSVQDRDRSNGLYFVRYLNPEGEVKKPGLLSRLAFWESDEKIKAEDYRIVLAEATAGTEVQVLSANGKPESSSAATRILNVLQEDLK